MIDVASHPIQTEHRAGRMLESLLASRNTRAKIVLTTDLKDGDGGSRYHQTFTVKRWNTSGGSEMLSVTSGKWMDGVPPITVLTLNVSEGRMMAPRDRRGDDRLLIYAAEAALSYAWLGDAGLPTPKNGSVTVIEEDICSCCGRALTDPVSIERGIGPECYGKITGTKTILSRTKPAPLAGQEALA